MKRYILIFALAIMLAFTSCSTTKNFTSEPYNNPNVPMEDKMAAAGVSPSKLDIPVSYFEAKDFLARLIEIVENTEDYLLMSTFLGSYSVGLEDLYEVIANRAREGVRVYLIIDGVSSFDMTETKNFMTPLYFLREAGVNLVEYNPVSGFRIIAPQSLLIRDHRKIIVSDGKISAIGGVNMNYISLGANNASLQKDSMYVFESNEFAAALTEEFVVAWNNSSIKQMKRDDFAVYEDPQELEKPLTGYIFNQGPNSKHEVAKLYGAAIGSAKEEIVILPYLPYFDEEMRQSIRDAVERGVVVKMYFPIDSRGYTKKALFYQIDKLAELGMEMYYEESSNEVPLLHEKLLVVDGKYTIIGSANLNFRSMGLSHEVSVLIEGEEFAESSLAHVKELTKDFIHLDRDTAKQLKKEGRFIPFLMAFIGG